jgi:hypothetical protein
MPYKELTPENIARESAKIGGFFPTKRNARDPEYLALVDLYKHVLGSTEAKIVNPLIFNTTICGTNGWARWRTGIPAEFKGLPKAEACPHLFHRWWRHLELDIQQVRALPREAEKAEYCRNAYADFLCIRPFRNANGRTALLMLYMMRRYVGLPLELVEYEEAPKLLRFVREYRKTNFLPAMEGRSFMLQAA